MSYSDQPHKLPYTPPYPSIPRITLSPPQDPRAVHSAYRFAAPADYGIKNAQPVRSWEDGTANVSSPHCSYALALETSATETAPAVSEENIPISPSTSGLFQVTLSHDITTSGCASMFGIVLPLQRPDHESGSDSYMVIESQSNSQESQNCGFIQRSAIGISRCQTSGIPTEIWVPQEVQTPTMRLPAGLHTLSGDSTEWQVYKTARDDQKVNGVIPIRNLIFLRPDKAETTHSSDHTPTSELGDSVGDYRMGSGAVIFYYQPVLGR